jgi:hypothetical protein
LPTRAKNKKFDASCTLGGGSPGSASAGRFLCMGESSHRGSGGSTWGEMVVNVLLPSPNLTPDFKNCQQPYFQTWHGRRSQRTTRLRYSHTHTHTDTHLSSPLYLSLSISVRVCV